MNMQEFIKDFENSRNAAQRAQKRLSANDFIKNHNHINYCEAIVYPDGTIQNAIPSHLETLLAIYAKQANLTRDKIQEEMKPYFSSMEFLLDKTGCVSIWYQGYLVPPKTTEQQEKSLQDLFLSGICLGNKWN